MTFLCPKCKQALDPARPKLKLCPSCGAAVPSRVIIQQYGSAVLLKEEAAIAERQSTGKRLTDLQHLIAKLRTIDPTGEEFYSAAAGHLRRKCRPSRTYGLFFIVFGTVPLPLTILYPAQNSLQVFIFIVGYIIFGGLGLLLFYHSSACLRNLSKKYAGDEATSRQQRLRIVAEHNPQDPIAALVLERFDDAR